MGLWLGARQHRRRGEQCGIEGALAQEQQGTRPGRTEWAALEEPEGQIGGVGMRLID